MVAQYSNQEKSSSISLSARNVALLTEELSTLLFAHLELDRALSIMLDASEDVSTSELLQILHRRIHEGADFSTALAEHPKCFSQTYINLVRAGELGGNLADVVGRLSNYLNMMLELRERLVSAMLYPFILLLVAGSSLLAVLVFVLPEFETLFADMGITLPLLTRLVMGGAAIFNQYWWVLLIFAVIGIAYFKLRYSDPGGRVQIDAFLIRLPFLGSFIKNWETARFSRNLSVLMNQGVPMTQSIAVAADAVGNRAIAESLHIAAGDLRLGGSISARLLQDNSLPRQASQMIQVGEESGELAPMLERVAALYDRKIGASLDRGLALLEPILILILAVIIAVIILSILLAILGLNNAPI